MVAITPAVLLAGGRGTRLGDLTVHTPKPLLPVGGRPFIEWVIDHLARQGLTEVVLTIGYNAAAFERWSEEYEGPVAVSTFVEEAPLGTGGALPLVLDRLEEAFFVLNGDTLLDAPLDRTAALLEDSEVLAGVALQAVEDTARFGAIRLEWSRISAFSEKGLSGPRLINGGTYVFRRSAFLGKRPPFSLEKDLLPELVEAGRVRGHRCDGFFLDIGLPETYEAAQLEVPRMVG